MFFGMSLMVKQMGVTSPFLLALLHLIYPNGRQPVFAIRWQFWRETSGMTSLDLFCNLALMSLAFALIAYLAQSSVGALLSNDSIAFPARLATAVTSFFRYLGVYFWPMGFTFTYPRVPEDENMWLVVCAVTFTGFLLYAAYRLRLRKPYISFAILWYFIAFLPVIGILQVGDQVMAMRYSDWPLIGIHLLVARSLQSVSTFHRRKSLYQLPGYSCILLLLMFLGVQSRIKAKYWASDGFLYRLAIEVFPGNPIAHAMLARHYMDDGKDEAAIQHLNTSLSIRPVNAQSLSNLALLHFNRGNPDLAWEASRKSLSFAHDMLEPQLVPRMLYAEDEWYEKAEEVFQDVVMTYPGSHLAWFNLTSVYRRQSRYQDAIKHYERSLEIDPTHWQTGCYLGECLEATGDFSLATKAYGNAIGSSVGASLRPIRGFVRMRLICENTDKLEALLRPLEEGRETGYRTPERIMYLIASGSQPSREEVSDGIVSTLSDLGEDRFICEVIVDAYGYLGNGKMAFEMGGKADSLWMPDARSTAALCRQARHKKFGDQLQ
jgi:hypothetical protein